MTPLWIEVDDEVIGAIKDAAEPFVDNPNRVLRRLLGLPPAEDDSTSPLPSTVARFGGSRAPSGSILPMAEYEMPILRALSQAGGSAPRPVVLDAVEEALRDRLTDVDCEPLPSGEMRWRARASGARMKLVERGLIRSRSRGLWELSEAGIEELGRLEAAAIKAERGATG